LICHREPGNPVNAKEIFVDGRAVKNHLAEHPDSEGKCRKIPGRCYGPLLQGQPLDDMCLECLTCVEVSPEPNPNPNPNPKGMHGGASLEAYITCVQPQLDNPACN
jgi:hypothetical protein